MKIKLLKSEESYNCDCSTASTEDHDDHLNTIQVDEKKDKETRKVLHADAVMLFRGDARL